jgi:hypothetical protein
MSSPKYNNIVFGRFRDVLNEGLADQPQRSVHDRSPHSVSPDDPIIPEALDLVEEELQVQEGSSKFICQPFFASRFMFGA